jgi:hypothetical protein
MYFCDQHPREVISPHSIERSYFLLNLIIPPDLPHSAKKEGGKGQAIGA